MVSSETYLSYYYTSRTRFIYLVITCPELPYAVHILSQFMQEAKEDHMEATRTVLPYLKGNPGQKILLSSNLDFQVCAFYDSDW